MFLQSDATIEVSSADGDSLRSPAPKCRARAGRRRNIATEMKKYLCDGLTEESESHIEGMIETTNNFETKS